MSPEEGARVVYELLHFVAARCALNKACVGR